MPASTPDSPEVTLPRTAKGVAIGVVRLDRSGPTVGQCPRVAGPVRPSPRA